jgi:hypothetical protein
MVVLVVEVEVEPQRTLCYNMENNMVEEEGSGCRTEV